MINEIYFQNMRALNWFDDRSDDPGEKLKFGKINVFAGPNGAGKSTIVDIIHSLVAPEKLASLLRNTTRREGQNLFSIHLGGNQITAWLDTASEGYQKLKLRVVLAEAGGLIQKSASLECGGASNKDAQDCHALLASLGSRISYVDENSKINHPDIFAKELCRIGPHLYGTHADYSEGADLSEEKFFPVSYDADTALFRVFLDLDGGFPAQVPLEFLPSGWQQFGRICSSLMEMREPGIFLLEEPEIHLHPTLQRLLIDRIIEIAEEKVHQIFITTHSNTLINAASRARSSVKLFSTRESHFEEVKASQGILEQLGLRASDILQTDGVLWVEGPSDRMYVNCWLASYAKLNSFPDVVENVDYSFCFYGGSILSHFQVSEEDELIDVIKMNRNAFFVIDNDNHFDVNANGVISVCRSPTKKRIIDELGKIGGGNYWVTKGYTMESYLPDEIRTANFDYKKGRLVLKDGKVKTQVAKSYVDEFKSMDECTDVEDLKEKVAMLYKKIATWSGSARPVQREV